MGTRFSSTFDHVSYKSNIPTLFKSAVIIMLFGGCSSASLNHFVVEPRLTPYTNQFFREAHLRGVSVARKRVIVSIKSLPVKTGAWGMTYYKNPVEIVVDQKFYLKNCGTKEGRLLIEFIVFHEFGHALLHRPHTAAYSVMNAKLLEIVDYSCKPVCRKILIDELFVNGREKSVAFF